MGIEVPPPRGGPADFSEQPESGSLSALTPGEGTGPEVGEDNDRNDEVSICLSEGSSQGILYIEPPNNSFCKFDAFYLLFSLPNFKSEVLKNIWLNIFKEIHFFILFFINKYI